MENVDYLEIQKLEDEINAMQISKEYYRNINVNELNEKEKYKYELVKRYDELYHALHFIMQEEDMVEIKNKLNQPVTFNDLGLKMLHSGDGKSCFYYYKKRYFEHPKFLSLKDLCGDDEEVLKDNIMQLSFLSKDRKSIMDFDYVISIRESTRQYTTKKKKKKFIVATDHLYRNFEFIKKKFVFDKIGKDKNFFQYQQNLITDIEIFDVKRNLIFIQYYANLQPTEDKRSKLAEIFLINNTHQVYNGKILPITIQDFQLRNVKILITDVSVTSLPIIAFLMQNNTVYLSCNYSLRSNKELKAFKPFKIKMKGTILKFLKGFFYIDEKIDDIFLMKKFILLNSIENKYNLDQLNNFLKNKEAMDLLDYEIVPIEENED
jgi:hypothetical protein